MGDFYLDGINDLANRAADYHVEVGAEYFDFKRDVWLRMTILAHVALTLIRTCVVQFLRGTQLQGRRPTK